MKTKRVMLIWGAAGGGHRSGMLAVRDALIELNPSTEIMDMDAYSRPWSYFPLTLVPQVYAFIVNHMPWAWALLFRTTNSQRGLRIAEIVTARLISPVFEGPLRYFRPDVVVCVIHSITGGLKRALKLAGQNPPIGMVVQDMVTLHHVWLLPEAAWFAMPTQEACQFALDSGFSTDRLHLLGMPLRKMFWMPPPDRTTLRQQLGLPETETVTLIVGGAGVHNLDAILAELLASDLPGHIAIVAVDAQRAKRRLEQKAKGRSVTILGRVSNISDWMWASDIMISKAGPNVIYEAMRCQLPMVLTDAIPDQETGNMWFVEHHGIGLVATRPAKIAAAANRILREPGLANSMKTAMKRMYLADAAQKIARLILDMD
jgi:UDP-N-acetylglucosamine:LPS N-acetylglucosamine transferase